MTNKRRNKAAGVTSILFAMFVNKNAGFGFESEKWAQNKILYKVPNGVNC